MYQFSLTYFVRLFKNTIDTTSLLIAKMVKENKLT
jgi:dynein heavy chain